MTPLQQGFHTLDHGLKTHRLLWQFDTFASFGIPWREYYPALAQWLEHTTMEDLAGEDFLQQVFQLCPDLPSALNVPTPSLADALPKQALTYVSSFLSSGIKGRKWEQIQAFVSHTPHADHYLEWCSGKGHLGKLLAYHHGNPVHSLEWQKVLCEAGEQEAKRRTLPQTFTHADVLKGEGRSALASTHCAVALHACGDLHGELIQQAVAANTSMLCISPCCYHLTRASQYHAFSHTGQQSTLNLRQADLKLAVKEVATAGAREQRLKQLELTYRLGFDAWQRCARQQDEYLPVPSIQKALLNQGFHAFCNWAAEQKGLTNLIPNPAFDDFEQIGQQRAQHVHKLEAISQLFRPALEHWLVLDRALYLEENGYHVDIGTFCDKSLTPRNWMIRAKQRGIFL